MFSYISLEGKILESHTFERFKNKNHNPQNPQKSGSGMQKKKYFAKLSDLHIP